MITTSQCKAARALIGMKQEQLAEAANVNKRTIMDFEKGNRNPVPSTLAALQSALEKEGVIFLPENGQGVGVRLRKN